MRQKLLSEGAKELSYEIREIVKKADQLKKLREDWKTVASGSRKIKADVFTNADRQRERKILDERFNREKKTEAKGKGGT